MLHTLFDNLNTVWLFVLHKGSEIEAIFNSTAV